MFLEEVASNANFYKDGFFGYGEPGDFTYFSFWHFLPIIILIASIILTYIYKDKIKANPKEKYIRFILAFILMVVAMSYDWRVLYTGNPGKSDLLSHLPFQVCTWSSFIVVFMLVTDLKWLFDYAVYVCLTLGMVPLVTPAVISTTGPMYYRYYQFFIEHMIPIYSVFYMIFIKDYRISLKRIWVPVVIIFTGALISILLNSQIEGANFFFLGMETEDPSLANVMPNNPWLKMLIYGSLGFLAFLALYGIFYSVDYLKQKREKVVLKRA